MAETPRIAILASGSGSTAEAFIRATQTDAVTAEVGLVVSNNSTAGVFDRVKRLNTEFGLDIQTAHISSKTNPWGSRNPGEQSLGEAEAIVTLLEDGKYTLGLLLGYMKKVRGDLLGWGQPTIKGDWGHARLLNTHPGPLPETAGMVGLGVQKHILASGLAEAGQTLHIVSADYDSGPVVAEHRFVHGIGIEGEGEARIAAVNAAAPGLFERVQLVEKQHIGPDVDSFLAGQL